MHVHCVLAVENEIAQIIKENLSKIEPYSDWEFEICENTWKLDEMSLRKPDVLVLSRFLPGEEPEKLLKDLPVMFSGSHIVLLVGALNEQSRGYLRACNKYGLENYVTGKLPGDRPYTLVTALRHNRDSSHGVIEFPEEDYEESYEQSYEDIYEDSYESCEEDDNTINTINEVANQNTPPEPTMPLVPELKQVTPERQVPLTQQSINQSTQPMPQINHQCPLGVHNQQPQLSNREEYQAINRWQAPRGQLTSVIGNKGGVGKTTTSATLAIALAESGVEVAIVDIDLASPNVADFFNLDVKQGIEYLAGRQGGIPMVMDQVLLPSPKYKNLYVLPGPMDKSVPVEALFQKGELANIFDVLMSRFPVVIADTPANFRICAWIPEVLQITDLALAVVDQSDFSEQDTARFAPELIIQGVHPQNIRIILNRFSPKLDNAKKVVNAFHAGFKKDIPKKQLPKIIATIPHDWNAHVMKGYKGEAVGLSDSRSQWHRVAEEIANKLDRKYDKPGGKKEKKMADQKKGLFGKFMGRR